MIEIVIPEEITLELVIGIIGIVLAIGGLVIHALKYLKDRPKLKLSFYKTNFEPKDGKLTLDMILENMGNLPTTAKDVWVIFGGYLDDSPHLFVRGTETIPVMGGSLKTKKIEGLNIPFKIESNDSYTIRVVCNFNKKIQVPALLKNSKKELEVIIKHTHGKVKVKKMYGK